MYILDEGRHIIREHSTAMQEPTLCSWTNASATESHMFHEFYKRRCWRSWILAWLVHHRLSLKPLHVVNASERLRLYQVMTLLHLAHLVDLHFSFRTLAYERTQPSIHRVNHFRQWATQPFILAFPHVSPAMALSSAACDSKNRATNNGTRL